MMGMSGPQGRGEETHGRKGDVQFLVRALCGVEVTGDPLQVAITLNKQNHTTQVVKAAEHFTLTVVSKTADMPFIGRFGFKSSADVDKFEGITTKTSLLFDPYTPEHACAMVCCCSLTPTRRSMPAPWSAAPW